MKCRLAAARGPDQRRGVVRRHRQLDVVQRLVLAVPRVQVFDLDAYAHRLCGSESAAAYGETHGRNR
jgi:hypothetical protein